MNYADLFDHAIMHITLSAICSASHGPGHCTIELNTSCEVSNAFAITTLKTVRYPGECIQTSTMCIVLINLLVFYSIVNTVHTQMRCSAPQFGFVDTPSVITITPDQTATMHCQLNYSVSCGTMIQANAIIIISADNYSTHEVCIPEARHDFHTEFEYITATCNYDSIQQYVQNMNTVTYTITLKGFNESSLREFVVVCGASRRNSVTEPFIRYSGLLHRNVIIKVEEQPMDSPKVFSRQIQESPAVVVMERDDVIITCEKLVTNYTTQVQWILTGSDLLQKNTLFVTSDKTILLKNGMTLELVLQNGEVYKDNNNYFQNFSIIISNLTTPLNGLIAKCGEWWAEGNISQFYEHAAVIAVTPRSPQDELIITSHQPRNITAKEGDNVTFMCARSNGTYAEWEFLFSDGNRYLYTQNETTLEKMGFDFDDSKSTTDGLQHFSVSITITVKMSNMIIRCAVQETEENNPIFNSFKDIIIVKKDPGLFDELSDKVVAIITTPTVVGTVVVTILVMIPISAAIIFLINRSRKHVQPVDHHNDIREDEQNDNDRVNKRITRELELVAHENNSGLTIFVNRP